MAVEHLFYHFLDGSKLLVNKNYAGELGETGGQVMVRAPAFIKVATNNADPRTYLANDDWEKYDLDGNKWRLTGGSLYVNNQWFGGSYANYCIEYDGNQLKLRAGDNSLGYSSAYYPAVEPRFAGDAPLKTANASFLDNYNQYITLDEFLRLANVNQYGYIRFTNIHTLLDESGHFVYATLNAYGSGAWIASGGAVYFATGFQTHMGGTWNAEFDYTASLYPDTVDPYDPYPPQPEPAPDLPGAFDFHSDPVPPPSLPSISAAATGFTRLYNPSLSQLNSLAQYMWTDQTFIQTVINQLKQLLDNPMDYIISLSLVPCAVPNGANVNVKLLFIDTGVQMPPVTNQFVEVDCGTYDVVRNYNSALDFAPNTKVSLYLPYIGVVPLDVDEIMPTYPDESTTLGVRYVIDVFGGTCVAMVTVNGSVKYQFSGHCAISIPFNSADFSTYAGALIQAAKTVVGAAAMAAGATGAGAALLGAPVQKTSESAQASGKVDDSGNFIDDPKVTMRVSSTKAQFGSLIANNISNTVSQVAASKPVIERSAGFSGNTGYMAVRRPYLLFESPRLVNPTEYGKYNGYPCMMYRSFAELSGFTQVQQIQLVGFSGTNPELDELQALLKSGVIF